MSASIPLNQDNMYKRKTRAKSPIPIQRPHSFPRAIQEQKKIDYEEDLKELKELKENYASSSSTPISNCKHEQK